MTERSQSDSAKTAAPRRRAAGGRRVPARTVIAVAVVAGFVAWVIVRQVSGGSPVKPAAKAPALPVALSGLRTLAAAVPSPIYWIGPQAGFTYELTQASGNQTFLRYLPAGVPAGSTAAFLTIGTYPVANAFAVTRKAAAASGSVTVRIKKGGVAFYNKSNPSDVYFAYPGTGYQIEVYDPSPGRAAELVSSGQVKPVVVKAVAVGARAVTRSTLKTLSTSRRQPIYWAGPASGVTYELSETSSGNVFLRYLPPGVKVGASGGYATIGTYPLSGAFTVTKALAAKPGAVRVAARGGAVAFYNSSSPTSVYLAYPNSNLQIEVYDPSAARARKLVTSNAIRPVG